MRPESTRSKARAQAGTTLIELMVVLAVSAFVGIGAMRVLSSIQLTHNDLQEITTVRQSARVALAQVHNDLLSTGVGLTSMAAVFPMIIPRDDGGMDLRFSPGAVSTFLTKDGDKGDSQLQVDSTDGFEVGDSVAVYDNSGALEFHEVASVSGKKITLSGSLGQALTVADGTALLRFETVSYRLESEGTARSLVREADGATATLAAGFTEFELTYFDEDGAAFTPATDTAQLRIRSVQVVIVAQSDDEMLAGPDSRTYRLTTRTAPRTITMANS